MRVHTHRVRSLARSCWCAALAVSAAVSVLHAQPSETLYVNANIYTMDDAHRRADAMLVRGDVISALGTRQELEPRVGARGMIIDLEGRTVLPGLADAHGHITGLGAYALGQIDLSNATSYEDLVRTVAARARLTDEGDWIVGGRWDNESWLDNKLPDNRTLSDLTPDNPVVLSRVDGHALLANKRALELAGVTAETPDPPGGAILRFDDGTPTGVLVDNAEGLVGRAMGDAASFSTEALILAAQERCLAAGLTSVHDAGESADDIRVFKTLDADGRLKLRVYGMVSAGAARSYFTQHGKHYGPRYQVRAVKLYADGAMGSRGAWLLEPYADRPTDDAGRPYTGLAVSGLDEMESLVQFCAKEGVQACTHAIGDRANREVLDIYERALTPIYRKQSYVESMNPRFRVEHAQLLHPDDISRFASLGVIASMQPTHCTSDMRWVEERVGEERARGAYAWASLLRTGAVIAAGSDFPVESHNPFLGFYAAVTRQNASSEPGGGWFPSERMTRDETLYAMTRAPAYASFQENAIGQLARGFAADFIVIDRDVMTCDPRQMLDTRVRMTVIAGDVVYQADD